MANICSYSFHWSDGQGKFFNDPDSYVQEVYEERTIGNRKHSPPISLLKAIKATGRLDWEEHGLLGVGYVILKEGVVFEQVSVGTPETIEECLQVMKTYPTLDVQNLIDQYEDELADY